MTVTEGNTGTVNVTFTITLSPASGQTVTVNYATADNTRHRRADYTDEDRRRCHLRPGRPPRAITVLVKGDLLDEINETFFVNLSTGQRHDRRRPGDRRPSPTTTPPALSIDDVTVTEGDAGHGQCFVWTRALGLRADSR